MERFGTLMPWVLVVLQLAGFVRVYLTSTKQHAHVPEAFIELHILAAFCLLCALGSIWGHRATPSAGWWVVRALMATSVLLVLVGHLRGGLG